MLTLPTEIQNLILENLNKNIKNMDHYIHSVKLADVHTEFEKFVETERHMMQCVFGTRPLFFFPVIDNWGFIDMEAIYYRMYRQPAMCIKGELIQACKLRRIKDKIRRKLEGMLRKQYYASTKCLFEVDSSLINGHPIGTRLIESDIAKREQRKRKALLDTQMGETISGDGEIKKLFQAISQGCSTLGINAGCTLPLKKLETFALSLVVLVQCKTYKQFVPSVLVCVSHLTDRTLTGMALTHFQEIADQLWHTMDETLHTQGYMRDLITGWERMADSKMLDKLREFMSFCMTFGVLEHFGLKQHAADIVYGEFKAQKKHKSVTSFALAFCDVLEFVISRLCVCVETRSLGPLFHNSDSYVQWYDNCHELINWSLMLGTDIEIRDTYYKEQQFQERCEECLKKGKEYVKFAKSIKDRRDITAITNKIDIIYADFMSAKIIGQPRQAPFTILLSGDSSIGKTSIQRTLVSVFANLSGLPDDPKYFYTRNPADDFMSGFKSYMWYINMDDVATTAPKMLTGVDTGVSELFLYVQNIACTANMADLNEKGKVAIRPEFIIATTNAPTLNAEAMFTCPSAARRRLPWRVTPTVKTQYRVNPDVNMLDPSKCDQQENQFPDYWLYTVEEIRPKPLRDETGARNLDAEEIMIMENADLKTFLSWFVSTAKTHRKRQSDVLARMKNSANVKMCQLHGLPAYMCDCLNEQLGTIETIGLSVATSSATVGGFLLYLRYLFFLNTWVQLFWGVINFRPRNIFNNLPMTPRCWEGISRERIGEIGSRAAESLTRRKHLMVFPIILTGVMIWKLMYTENENKNQKIENENKNQKTENKKLDSQIKFVKPTIIQEKEKVRWVTEIPVFDRCNVLPQSVSTLGRTEREVFDQISKNVVNVRLTDGTREWFCNFLFLGGFDVAINSHDFAILPDVTTATLLFYDKYTHIGKNTTIIFDKRGLETVQYHDVTIVCLEEFGLFPSIKNLFPKEALKGRFNGTYLYRNKEGLMEEYQVKNLECEYRRNPIATGEIWDFHVYTGHVEEDTFSGLCGAPMVAKTAAGYVILGIHSLGGKKNLACSSVITQKLLNQTRNFDIGTCDMGELESQMQLNDNKFLVKPVELNPTLRLRDPLAYRLKGTGEVYGSLATGPSNPKSKVQSTFVREFWEGQGFVTDHVAPRFGAKCWHNGLDDMMSPDILISTSEANFIARCIARDFIAKMTKEQKDMIEFYDLETAIIGADGVIGVDKLDFKTSTGFPMKKCKKSIFEQLPNGRYSVPKEIIASCDKIHENIRAGKRNQVIFSSALKDESRPLKKVESWSIRIFMGAPVPYCIVMRQHFLSLARVIQNSPLQFETAVGINAHSSQWDVLANTLSTHSPLFIVGDHSKYDKRMTAVYIYNMFKVAIYIIMHCMLETGKISKQEEKEVEDRLLLLATDTAYAYIDYNGTLVSFLKNHVSGHVLTVIINSFGNSGYIRMAYRRVVTDDPDLTKFQERCCVVTYGDDFIVSVKPEISQFNFMSMKKAMGEFGVIITPAVKTDDDYEFLELSQIDFLKRKFVFHEDLQRWVGPLDMKSIEKSLLISVRSDSITPEEQSIYAMMSAQQEMFAYGREAFEDFTDKIFKCIEQMKLIYLVKKGTFPTYDQLLAKYQNKSIVHCDDFVENGDDEVLFDLFYPPLEDNLTTQCGCKKIMKLNRDRMDYDRDFYSDYLERDYKTLFKCRVTGPLRKLVLRCQCSIPSFSCSLFCERCQQGPQTDFTADLILRDCQSLDLETQLGFNPQNTLTRVEQPTSTANEIVEVSQSPSADTCLKRDTEKNQTLYCQMEENNVQFVDEIEGDTLDLSEYPDPSRTNDELNTATFGDYLKRPVKIFTTTWSESTTLNTTFQPWQLWANQTQIKQKLNNYGLFRGRLHLKMLVNASPFFYGAGRLTYEPLIGYMRKDTVGYGSTSSGYLIQKSQQKGFEFFPHMNQGGEMVLPFFYPKTWVDLTSSNDLATMGRCSLFSYTPLSNANSVTTASVTITIIAWCEDVEISAPTYRLAVQSEYKKLGPISGPASAVAEAARSLSRIPIIKPYAMGTEMIASSIGSVAKYFGFTNVPTTTAQNTFKPGSHYGMATTEISTPYEKLSLDDKNELTIDPRVVGLQPKDEMVISEIIKRESYLTQATWAATDSVNTMLFNTYVTPSLYDYSSYSLASTYAYYQTPMAHLSRLFTSWRGSIIFRFRFVCTSFHKGRIRITWDPRYDLSGLTSSAIDDTLTTTFTKIVDIGETQDVELEIPYMQALAFMTNYGVDASSPVRLYARNALPSVSSWNSYFNGTLSVTVLNAQTSPVTSSDIQMLIFVKAGGDFTFANPRDAPANLTFLAPQMEEKPIEGSQNQEHLMFTPNTGTGELFKIHMGEAIVSMRQLIHRQNFYNCFIGKAGSDAQSAGTYNRWILPRYPVINGYTSPGRNNLAYAAGVIVPGSTLPVSYSAPSVFSLIAPLYIGARGAMTYNVNVDAPQASNLVSLARTVNVDYVDHAASTKQGWYNPFSWDIYSPSSLGGPSKYRSQTFVNGAAGRVLTNQNTQAGIMAHFPYYSPLRFTSSVGYLSSDDATILPIPVEEQNQGVELLISTKNNQTATIGNETATEVDVYMMAGHDFTFLYFNCVPTFYYYQTNYSATS